MVTKVIHFPDVIALYNVRYIPKKNIYNICRFLKNSIKIIKSFSRIYKITVIEPPKTPCSPTPCGINAICKERNGAGSCSCVPEYYGDPYVECRPECIMNSDCPKNRACINQRCKDPCPGTCGLNAECHILNHSPACICIQGYTGNPQSSCYLPPPSKNCYHCDNIFSKYILLILIQ